MIMHLPMQNNWMLEQCILSITFESTTKLEKKIKIKNLRAIVQSITEL